MNYKDDSFVKNLFYTLQFIAYIVLSIVARVKDWVDMPLILYIVIGVVLLLVNSVTYLPLYSGYFVILKLMGRLTVGWGWISVTLIMDIIVATMVSELRSSNS